MATSRVDKEHMAYIILYTPDKVYAKMYDDQLYNSAMNNKLTFALIIILILHAALRHNLYFKVSQRYTQ